MAKPFRAQQAKGLLKRHRALYEELSAMEALIQQDRDEVLNASNLLVTQEVLKVLQDLPIEEINREKRGFRVKTLHEAGYHTIRDLFETTTLQLAYIRGISREKAVAIKNTVNKMSHQIREGMKIRLSVDHKDPRTTALVTALHNYQKELSYAASCR